MGLVDGFMAGQRRARKLSEASDRKTRTQRRERLVAKGFPPELVDLYSSGGLIMLEREYSKVDKVRGAAVENISPGA